MSLKAKCHKLQMEMKLPEYIAHSAFFQPGE